MIHISILVLKEAILSSIDAPRQLFSKVNEFLEAKGQSPMFRVNLVSSSRETRIGNDRYTIRCDQTLDEIAETDLIIIPMICMEFPRPLKLTESSFHG